MLKNVRLPSLRAPHNPLAISSQTGIVYAELKIELVPRNWPGNTMDMNSKIENRH